MSDKKKEQEKQAQEQMNLAIIEELFARMKASDNGYASVKNSIDDPADFITPEKTAPEAPKKPGEETPAKKDGAEQPEKKAEPRYQSPDGTHEYAIETGPPSNSKITGTVDANGAGKVVMEPPWNDSKVEAFAQHLIDVRKFTKIDLPTEGNKAIPPEFRGKVVEQIRKLAAERNIDIELTVGGMAPAAGKAYQSEVAEAPKTEDAMAAAKAAYAKAIQEAVQANIQIPHSLSGADQVTFDRVANSNISSVVDPARASAIEAAEAAFKDVMGVSDLSTQQRKIFAAEIDDPLPTAMQEMESVAVYKGMAKSEMESVRIAAERVKPESMKQSDKALMEANKDSFASKMTEKLDTKFKAAADMGASLGSVAISKALREVAKEALAEVVQAYKEANGEDMSPQQLKDLESKLDEVLDSVQEHFQELPGDVPEMAADLLQGSSKVREDIVQTAKAALDEHAQKAVKTPDVEPEVRPGLK